MNHRLPFLLPVAALGLVLLNACHGGFGPAQPPTPTPSQVTTPVVIQGHGSLPAMTLDEVITESALIVIGRLAHIYPSRWNTDDGKMPTAPWIKDVLDAIGDGYDIFTEVDILVSEVLKGEVKKETVRICILGGEVEGVRLTLEGSPSIVGAVQNSPAKDYPTIDFDHTYLFFLHRPEGMRFCLRNTQVEIFGLTGALQGMMTISDDGRQAYSIRWGEFSLEELRSYILARAFWTPVPTPTFSPARFLLVFRQNQQNRHMWRLAGSIHHHI